MELNRREIPRFARNDKINYFFRSLHSEALDALQAVRTYHEKGWDWKAISARAAIQ
jgi:hypothetical protein